MINIREGLRMSGRHRFIFRDAVTGEIKWVNEYDNLITNTCFSMIADRLSGGGNDCNITYSAVGTGTTAPTITDTTLETELARKTIVSASYSTNIVSISSFFGASEANGTLAEFALFGEAASATVDTGTMINHAAISETKTSSETLTIETTITSS